MTDTTMLEAVCEYCGNPTGDFYPEGEFQPDGLRCPGCVGLEPIETPREQARRLAREDARPQPDLPETERLRELVQVHERELERLTNIAQQAEPDQEVLDLGLHEDVFTIPDNLPTGRPDPQPDILTTTNVRQNFWRWMEDGGDGNQPADQQVHQALRDAIRFTNAPEPARVDPHCPACRGLAYNVTRHEHVRGTITVELLPDDRALYYHGDNLNWDEHDDELLNHDVVCARCGHHRYDLPIQTESD